MNPETETTTDFELWDLYFSGIVGWSLHPGYLKTPDQKPTLQECANLADQMILIRRTTCHG